MQDIESSRVTHAYLLWRCLYQSPALAIRTANIPYAPETYKKKCPDGRKKGNTQGIPLRHLAQSKYTKSARMFRGARCRTTSLSDRCRSPASTAIYTPTSINSEIGNKSADGYCPTANRGCATVSATRRMTETKPPWGGLIWGR